MNMQADIGLSCPHMCKDTLDGGCGGVCVCVCGGGGGGGAGGGQGVRGWGSNKKKIVGHVQKPQV